MSQAYPIYDTTSTEIRCPITKEYFVKVTEKNGVVHYMHPNAYRDLLNTRSYRMKNNIPSKFVRRRASHQQSAPSSVSYQHANDPYIQVQNVNIINQPSAYHEQPAPQYSQPPYQSTVSYQSAKNPYIQAQNVTTICPCVLL